MEKVMKQSYCSSYIERATIYSLLKVGFEGPITIDSLKLWKDSFYPEFIEVLMDQNEYFADFFEDIKTTNLETIEKRERAAYLATFNLLNQEGKVPAPPWESVYVTQDQTLFGKPVFQLRTQFDHFGLSFIDKNSNPEDHIAVELEFMCYLIDYTWEAYISGDESAYTKGIYTQYWLHKEHFQHWIHSFTNHIRLSETSRFYKGLAELLRVFLSEDFEYINLLKEELDHE